MIRDLSKNPFPSIPIIDEDDIKRVEDVLRSGKLVYFYGKYVREFEKEFASYYGVKHAVATSSGTTALHAVIEAVGIGPGDEVITTPITFIATANAILHNGAIPVFADIDPKTYCISPDSIVEKITERTRAIIPVHIFGHPCDMDPIMEIAEDHDLIVIEDCAQAHGAKYKGRKVGTMGIAGCFSLWENKNIATGEGGVVITNDDELAERLRSIINHYRPRVSPLPGVEPWNVFVGIGYNYRMTEMQGALGIGQIRKLDRFNAVRRRIANFYMEALRDVPGIKLPYIAPEVEHSWYMFVSQIDEEVMKTPLDDLLKEINAEFGITPETPFLQKVAIRTLMPLYAQPVFSKLIGRGKTRCPFFCPLYKGKIEYKMGMCPNAEKFYETSFALFINHAMTIDDARDVAEGVRKVFIRHIESPSR